MISHIEVEYAKTLRNPAKAQAEIVRLGRELVAARKDTERLLFLMNQSGEFYMRGYQYHIIGRLREYIDAAMKESGK